MKRTYAAAIAGLVMTGGALVATPILAGAQESGTSTDSPATTQQGAGRHMGGFLDDLVADGTITQEQADTIREQFRAKMGERRENMAENRAERAEVIAGLLGITTDELRAAHESGQTLAEVAVANGVSVDTLVAGLVDAANEKLDAKVADGTITAERADTLRAQLTERITARVNGERPEGPGGGHHGGPFGRGGPMAPAANGS